MGYVFEDLVRRFNEQANEEAGDHFTPREVIKLMVNVLFTYDDLVYTESKVIKIYDPTAGTGGMLSESEKLIIDPERGLNPSANLELFGQEYNPESYAICGSDLMIKGEDVKNIVYGMPCGPLTFERRRPSICSLNCDIDGALTSTDQKAQRSSISQPGDY